MMCAAFSSAPLLALTATASYKDISIIKESLNLKKKRWRLLLVPTGQISSMKKFFVKTLEPIAAKLKEKK